VTTGSLLLRLRCDELTVATDGLSWLSSLGCGRPLDHGWLGGLLGSLGCLWSGWSGWWGLHESLEGVRVEVLSPLELAHHVELLLLLDTCLLILGPWVDRSDLRNQLLLLLFLLNIDLLHLMLVDLLLLDLLNSLHLLLLGLLLE